MYVKVEVLKPWNGYKPGEVVTLDHFPDVYILQEQGVLKILESGYKYSVTTLERWLK